MIDIVNHLVFILLLLSLAEIEKSCLLYLHSWCLFCQLSSGMSFFWRQKETMLAKNCFPLCCVASIKRVIGGVPLVVEWSGVKRRSRLLRVLLRCLWLSLSACGSCVCSCVGRLFAHLLGHFHFHISPSQLYLSEMQWIEYGARRGAGKQCVLKWATVCCHWEYSLTETDADAEEEEEEVCVEITRSITWLNRTWSWVEFFPPFPLFPCSFLFSYCPLFTLNLSRQSADAVVAVEDVDDDQCLCVCVLVDRWVLPLKCLPFWAVSTVEYCSAEYTN